MEREVIRYQRLNELARHNGIVIFGCKEDVRIPLCELRQAFSVEADIYNRSIGSLSVKDAVTMYERCVAPLAPETVLVHIGEADLDFFAQDPAAFDNQYRELIACIRKQDTACRIAVIALRNYDKDPGIAALNAHLKGIADSERCEFGDIAVERVWNPRNTIDAADFLRSIGAVRSRRHSCPLYDLVKIVFCWDTVCAL